MLDAKEHFANLAGPTFLEQNSEPAVFDVEPSSRRSRARFDRHGQRAPTVQNNAGTEFFEVSFFRSTLYLDLVDLGTAKPRVRDPLSELAVGGEQQQALAVEVEAPDRKKRAVQTCGQQVEHRRAPFGVAHGRHEAGWFVEHEVALAMLSPRADSFAIDFDRVFGQIDLLSGLRDSTIDRHPTFADQLFDLAARRDTCPCQNFL